MQHMHLDLELELTKCALDKSFNLYAQVWLWIQRRGIAFYYDFFLHLVNDICQALLTNKNTDFYFTFNYTLSNKYLMT